MADHIVDTRGGSRPPRDCFEVLRGGSRPPRECFEVLGWGLDPPWTVLRYWGEGLDPLRTVPQLYLVPLRTVQDWPLHFRLGLRLGTWGAKQL